MANDRIFFNAWLVPVIAKSREALSASFKSRCGAFDARRERRARRRRRVLQAVN
jgi:hypothetical protein